MAVYGAILMITCILCWLATILLSNMTTQVIIPVVQNKCGGSAASLRLLYQVYREAVWYLISSMLASLINVNI